MGRAGELPFLNTRWDNRYPHEDPEVWRRPSRLLVEHVGALPVGRALDVACGPARNAVFLAERGFVVDAVDNSREGLGMARRFAADRGVSVNLIFADLTRYAVRPETYDLVLNFFYLDRELMPALTGGLKAGGYLIFESFTTDNARFAPARDPRHFLGPNELLELARGLRVLFYREGTVIEAGMVRATARLVARKEG
jgi:tellurite methyltransferase